MMRYDPVVLRAVVSSRHLEFKHKIQTRRARFEFRLMRFVLVFAAGGW